MQGAEATWRRTRWASKGPCWVLASAAPEELHGNTIVTENEDGVLLVRNSQTSVDPVQKQVLLQDTPIPLV